MTADPSVGYFMLFILCSPLVAALLYGTIQSKKEKRVLKNEQKND